MPEPGLRHLTAAAVIAIHEEVLRAHGGQPGMRDAALLESAVAAPQATFEGEPLIADPIEIAAAYLFYLCRNHPFIDGNKRTELAASLVFLEANGRLSDERIATRDPDAWEALVQEVAGSRVDRIQTARRLKRLLRGAFPRRRRQPADSLIRRRRTRSAVRASAVRAPRRRGPRTRRGGRSG